MAEEHQDKEDGQRPTFADPEGGKEEGEQDGQTTPQQHEEKMFHWIGWY